jgi:uncharacterized protein YecE (DUF72 family)
MSKGDCDIRIGTSGWHYEDWSGRFYPPDLPKSKWLEYYSGHFDTVEINNTFYHLPKETTFQNWRKKAPNNFIFTVKANRYITHVKRLKDPPEPLVRFYERANILQKHLGPVLYQLPPNFHKDFARLKVFLQALQYVILNGAQRSEESLSHRPDSSSASGKLIRRREQSETVTKAVFEFRHESWFSQDTYNLLKKFNAAFCIHDLIGIPTPRVITGDIIYIRFHGPTGKYEGNYSKSALQDWAKWIKENIKGKKAIYAYFNNDYHAYAIKNAKALKGQIIN